MKRETFIAPGMVAHIITVDSDEFYDQYHSEGPVFLQVLEGDKLIFSDSYKLKGDALAKLYRFFPRWASRKENKLRSRIRALKAEVHETEEETRRVAASLRAQNQYELDKIHAQGLLTSLALIAGILIISVI